MVEIGRIVFEISRAQNLGKKIIITRHDLVASNEEVFRPIFRIWNDLTLDLRQRNDPENEAGSMSNG
jgi:hypothetical protein